MRLLSPAFANGQPLPRRFTCDGENVSPPLQWTSVPPETRSFALVCSDPDAPRGTFNHWAIFDLPASLTGLTEGQVLYGIRGGINDFGKLGYGGPCPPRGHGTHQYVFELFAFPVDRLDCGLQPSGADVARAARKQAAAVARLTGLYAR
ncbi:YbhB/YbcL family Raf kinase inhibitor-like protein [Xanthobacter agilis]|jgi:Raf kinase inhibitor-like YbhB/YbcL family protein|uniref:Raf kinase inhibitor-like YbhB/YbcL family protein n=1 Tax=Xanthobacter agilis TaxID=47492 RepID=A0ABU0LBW3_XANAG|nr:YbhB/YbcL family Raf kinase inhibitor-like protein [Xanthobacter agilis]MDQ0504642.1 Raf kinase inhibitor-like YbhB/YbcL family protein [Xanthobacter agilis]